MQSHAGRNQLVIVLLTLVLPCLFGFTNPHVGPDTCDDCHIRVPTQEEAARGYYALLRATIDDTCMMCHEDRSCSLGTWRIRHPSGVDRWNPAVAEPPVSLPIFGGRIACSTCHLHRKPDVADYKMLRNVRVDGARIDATDLCADCHLQYF